MRVSGVREAVVVVVVVVDDGVAGEVEPGIEGEVVAAVAVVLPVLEDIAGRQGIDCGLVVGNVGLAEIGGRRAVLGRDPLAPAVERIPGLPRVWEAEVCTETAAAAVAVEVSIV